MHELAITQGVVDAVTERLGDTRVSRVVLEIGRLSGVAVESVRFCFPLVAEGTPLAGARLDIVEPPGRGRCRRCGRETELVDPLAVCPCGSADLELTSGRQLLVKRVEVA
ncbi:hydrogenase maturation nickel metallochaperone HypA/HybF [Gandjariella thermophila]|uniref:Hydrogenase maturation factor HypA n=1 Tax=Gandjariella thermophila TaxID=1931992 RepID=A0A4D4J467_9PSEU|nr:hydrogenase maturation nickel metallochaperone HypA [Gandjariella thermophila]GDY28753.1 hydrogenase nickel incorporation protein HypA [Gandjariella thermophila]